MMEDKNQPKKKVNKTLVKTTLIVVTAATILSLGPWLLMALFSIMFFDAPGSARRVLPWLAFSYVWLYPFIVLPATIVAWINYSDKKFHRAFKVGLMPVIYWLILGLFFGLSTLLGATGNLFAKYQLQQKGFSCPNGEIIKVNDDKSFWFVRRSATMTRERRIGEITDSGIKCDGCAYYEINLERCKNKKGETIFDVYGH